VGSSKPLDFGVLLQFHDWSLLEERQGGFVSRRLHKVSLADESELRIFASEAVFARVGREDFPMDFVNEIPKFQQAIGIDFSGKQMRWYLAG
jgi:hypothetical protein